MPEKPSVPMGPTAEQDWNRIAASYNRPKDVIQLENGNWGVMAKPVRDAYVRNLDLVNTEGSYFTRQKFGPIYADAKQRVADLFGVKSKEIAFTRNATEALQRLISGYNLLKPGDAILYADHDYPAMQDAMDWLQKTQGVDVIKIALPEPATWQNILDCYAAAFAKHPRIKLALLTHAGHRNGLILPIKEICELADAHVIDVIVDAAHSLGQIDCTLPQLGAKFIGFNLHKWFGAPLGVGGFYIREDHIPAIDPHLTAKADRANIHTRIHTGTTDFAAIMTVPAALDFHTQIGGSVKEARLRHLRQLWTEPLRDNPQIEILTPDDPRLSCGIAAFRLRGRNSMAENEALSAALLQQFGIFTVAREGLSSGACIRVTPSLFNIKSEMEKLTAALTLLARQPPNKEGPPPTKAQ